MSWQTELEDELDWRFAELAILKFQAARAATGSLLQEALLRALCAMLYAHYEGFCKQAIRIYLKEIKQVGTKREDCRDQLAVFTLQETFRQVKGMNAPDCWGFFKVSLHQKLAEIVDYELDKQGEIALEGDSNLYPNLLRTNLQNVCLPHAEVDAEEHRLKNLVGRRNGIAHGKKLTIADLPTYEEYENAASSVMYGLAYAIFDALEQKSYRKPVPYSG